MKKKKLILFDFDGTLLDSDQMIVVTFQQLYELYKKDNIFDLKKVLTFSGPPIKETLKNEFPDIDQDFIFNEFVRLSTINYDKYVHLFPYFLKFLMHYLFLFEYSIFLKNLIKGYCLQQILIVNRKSHLVLQKFHY